NVIDAEQVDCWSVPVSAEQLTVWSGPVSENTIILGMVPVGMYCAWTLTVTGLEVLIVASEKLNGLAFIGIPLMFVTLIELGGVAGSARLNGVDCIPRTQSIKIFPRRVNASRRINQLLPAEPVA